MFHIEHIIAKQHGGGEAEDNLALACHRCNLQEGPNLSGIDPDTGALVPLFHPHRDLWGEHLQLRSFRIEGLTPHWTSHSSGPGHERRTQSGIADGDGDVAADAGQ